MNWLSNLFLCATIAFFFGLLVFVITMAVQDSALYVKLTKRNWRKFLTHFFTGMIMAAPCAFIYYLSHSYGLTNVFSAVCAIIVIFPTVMYVSPFFGLGALGINAIFSFLAFHKETYIDGYIMVSFATYVIITFIMYYCTKKLNSNIKGLISESIFMLIQALVISPIIYASRLQFFDHQTQLWTNYAILHVFFFLTFLICIYLNRIYLKTQRMRITVHYKYDHFIDRHNAIRKINEYIRINNVQYGFIVGFNIRQSINLQNNLGARIINQLNEAVAKKIYETFNKNDAVFFINGHNAICMFVKTDNSIASKMALMYKNNTEINRKPNDPMSILNFPNEYDFTIPEKNLTIKSKVTIMTSIYGVQTSSVEEAIDNVSRMIIDNQTNDQWTNVQLYDEKIYESHETDIKNFIKLRNSTNINKIKIKFEQINYQDHNFYIPIFTYHDKLLFGTNQILSIVKPELRITLMRYLAATAMQLFAYETDSVIKKILIKYPMEPLNDKFYSPTRFSNKITFYQLSSSNVVLIFNMNFLAKDHSCFLRNVKLLRDEGVQVVCTNVTAEHLKLVKEIDPLFILFKEYKNLDKKKELQYKKMMKTALKKLNVQYYNK